MMTVCVENSCFAYVKRTVFNRFSFSEDDWETDATYDNKITENEQRWGKDVNQRSGAIE